VLKIHKKKSKQRLEKKELTGILARKGNNAGETEETMLERREK
jgi:hypothetical protein